MYVLVPRYHRITIAEVSQCQRQRERSDELAEDREDIEQVEEEILEDDAEGVTESDGELLSTQR